MGIWKPRFHRGVITMTDGSYGLSLSATRPVIGGAEFIFTRSLFSLGFAMFSSGEPVHRETHHGILDRAKTGVRQLPRPGIGTGPSLPGGWGGCSRCWE
uniref:Uncharacterized protein n=1 Tax=Hippocampus comes TaxID=109280 RepID=A0A3Q2YNX1_HIPCM